MITDNYKSLVAMQIPGCNVAYGGLRVINTGGWGLYLYPGVTNDVFPRYRSDAIQMTKGSAGISFGSGDTPPKGTDYNLENHISSGINAVIVKKEPGVDEDGRPYVKYVFTITNTSSEQVQIREIGYKQTCSVHGRPGAAGTLYTNTHTVLIDRTVLDDPLILNPDDAGTIVYYLKMEPLTNKTVNGIKIVSFTFGSDSDIANMLDAAAEGVIDLQEDAGWVVSDMRKIHVSAFEGANDVAFGEQDVHIVLSSFEPYNGSNSLLQFDFYNVLSTKIRMHGSMVSGGYKNTEMATITMPALVNALPAYIKNRLVPFKILCFDTPGTGNVVEVNNVKLALRARSETLGDMVGEGDQLTVYTSGGRTRYAGLNGTSDGVHPWWTRTPCSAYSYTAIGPTGGRTDQDPTTAGYILPFGCLGGEQ